MAAPNSVERTQIRSFRTLWRDGRIAQSKGSCSSSNPSLFTSCGYWFRVQGSWSRREEIQEALWPNGTTVEFSQGLNFCIRQIRAALNDDARDPRFIETLPKRGYRFIAPVDSVPSDETGL